MAYRIHKEVVSGELDNTVRGQVTGTLSIVGCEYPVKVRLDGNFHRDIAGCRISFRNPFPDSASDFADSLDPLQYGTVGDITASRKVRVPEVPIRQFMRMKSAGLQPPEHWGNGLYIEWFSDRNGRVVIESTDYEVTVSAPEWTLSEEEDRQLSEEAEQNCEAWLHKLSTSFDEAEGGSFEVTTERLPPHAPNPLTEGKYWIRCNDLAFGVCHPLYKQCRDTFASVYNAAREGGFEDDDNGDPDVMALIEGLEKAFVRIGTSLNMLAYKQEADIDRERTAEELTFIPPVIDDAVVACDSAAAKDLLAGRSEQSRAQIFALREAIMDLIADFRTP